MMKRSGLSSLQPTGAGSRAAHCAAGGVVALLLSAGAHAQDVVFATHNTAQFVSVIDTATHAVQTIPLAAGNNGIAAAPDGSAVYVVVSNVSVQIIETATMTVTDTIPMTGLVFGIRVSPDGTRAYVTRGNPPAVFVIDLVEKTVLQELTTISNAVYLDMTPDGSHVYISTSRIAPVLETWLSVLETATNTITQVIDVARYPAEIAVAPDGQSVWMSNEFDASVSILDRSTHTIVEVIPVGNQPRGITFNESGSHAYVMNASTATISVIDTATRTVVATIPTWGGFPISMQILDGGETAFVARWSASTVGIVDLATNELTTNIPLSARPYLLMGLTLPADDCYANCDGSTTEPILTVDDFTCFINQFAAAQGLTHEEQIEHYANCDGSTAAPVLTVDDFTCFINAFAAGCP